MIERAAHMCILVIFFFKQKTAYEMRISDWSSDVCSSDLLVTLHRETAGRVRASPAGRHRPTRTPLLTGRGAGGINQTASGAGSALVSSTLRPDRKSTRLNSSH